MAVVSSFEPFRNANSFKHSTVSEWLHLKKAVNQLVLNATEILLAGSLMSSQIHVHGPNTGLPQAC